MPEMSYSPAYHQAKDSTAASAPRNSRPMEYPEPAHQRPRPSSEWRTSESPRTSGPGGYRTYSPQATFPEGNPTVTQVVLANGSSYKEQPSRSSWADQPSLMSLENSGTPRVRKRGVSRDRETDHCPNALLLLFRLSVPVPVFSLIATIYTFLALLFAILTTPLRLCSINTYLSSISFSAQICDLLAPALHTHERLVLMGPPSSRSSSTQWIRSDLDAETTAGSSQYYRVGMSIIVLILAPLLSIAILLFAWTAAFFWVFSKVMGNPDGTERSDDGRAAVLGVCKWWQAWLAKARRPS
ncbi:hypothetical protein N7468_005397 [Penicillium chermesinum]|uniref:Uncharacterized protein n=1 Tax=Penicillium chermesinum TaxID=63820 RepID=A0A9W9NZ41_9EURO|nr:uncharacterized protein N7468_005397 [Penicillium chermesinum]KAJ5232441.1 hypothetical protein N7468_005397 [Penicillium chermesinum]